jgi:glycosyltransferase involved in cell wall biosynthesis
MATVYAPRLRIAIDPVYVQSANLTSSSTYQKYVTLVRELVARGHYVYWLIPDNEYVPNEIEEHPNVGIIRTSYIQDQFVVDGLVTDKFFNLFNRVSGKYQVDVLLTSRTSLGLVYKRILEAPRFHDTGGDYTDKVYGLPTMVVEEFPQTRERQHSGQSYWLMQMQGYIGSDKTVFLSDHNRDEVLKEMYEWFKTSKVLNFSTQQAKIIPSGIECSELDQFYDCERFRHHPNFKVLSIGRIMSVGHLEFLTWYDYLFKSGMTNVELVISLSGALGGPMRAKLDKIGVDMRNSVGRQFKIMENNPRRSFLKMLRNYHCFIAPMSHLDHPTGLFEAVYLGLPGIMPISDYQRTFFSDWPWVIDPRDKVAFLTHLNWINQNRDEAREMVKPWRDRIRERYDAPTNIRKLADEVEGLGRDYINRFKTSKGVVDMMRELKGHVYSWDDLVYHLRRNGRMGVSIGDMGIRTTFTYSRSAIHHSMRLVGYVDPCDRPYDYFVRRADFDSGTWDRPDEPVPSSATPAKKKLSLKRKLK